ncbi:MAG: glycosyltransferase [Luteitalea sp.]|nr:glycosyltransferase [Luteitalea sp.]
MRIAIDARELGHRPTGVGRYLAELLARWTRSPAAREHELTLYIPALPPYRDELVGAGGATVVWRLLPRPSRGAPTPFGPGAAPLGWRNVVWEQHHLARAARRDPPDVLFCPAYSAPLAVRVPVVLTLHDISFVAHPEWFGWREGLRRRLLATRSARRARRVITMSRFSAGEIERRLGVPPGQIVTVPLAVDHQLGQDPGLQERPRTREPIVLYVGSIFKRRNVPVLIRAFSRVAAARSDVRLVVVGEDRSHPPEHIERCIAESGCAARMTWRPYVLDAELAALYARASIFVYLSTYEGFGLTPLEALSAGMPIIVADTAVAREVYGDAAAFVDPHSVDDVANALGALLDRGELRAAILDAAPRVLQRYRWEATAAATLRVLEEATR